MLRIRLLGKPQVVLDGNEVASFISTKAQALLIYVLVTRERHSRHALAGLFWADDPEPKAKNSLRVALSNINKLLPGTLESDRLYVAPAADRPVWLDTDEFDADLEAASTRDLERVIELYRGEYLADFYIEGAPEFEAWLLAQRAAWREKAVELLSALAARHMAGRRYGQAAATLRRLLEIEPWEEPAHRQLMLALSRRGDFNAALAQYESCRRLLDEELGLEPMPETTALYQRIRQARQRPAQNLPAETAPLVGRIEELNQLHQMVDDPACRLITITGLGGMGKTRLALAAARQAAGEQALQFLNGFAFIPLAGVEEARDVPQAMAASLEVSLTGMVEARLAVLNYLADREMLLILDNFEHLLEAATFLDELLAGCPDLKVIVSSREPLNLGLEWRLDLAGLPYPPPDADLTGDDPLTYDAVQLFLQAGQQARPGFALEGHAADVIRLCQLVAGMPLALKLAAPWLRSMTPAQVVAKLEASLDLLSTKLRDVPHRQRSMRAIFDSTWNLLSSGEQEVLAALSIFRGGFDEEAAVAVAGASPQVISSLIDHGLLLFDNEGRYALHELTRHYAGDKLEGSGRLPAVAGQHSRYYLGLAASQEASLHGDKPQLSVALLRQNLDNLRAAWDHALEEDETDGLLASAEAVASFFEVSGLDHEGEETFAQAAGHFTGTTTPAGRRLRCALLLAQTRFADVVGSYETAESLLDEAILLAQETDSPEYLADGYRIRGTIYSAIGRQAEARQDQEAALALYRELRNRRLEATTLSDLGWTCIMDEAYDQALDYLAHSLELFADLPDKRGISFALGNTAVAHAYKGELQTALDYTWQVLDINEEIDYPLGIARMTNNIGLTYVWMGRYGDALPHLETALAMHRKMSARAEIARTAESLASALVSLGRHERALPLLEEALQFTKTSGYTYLDCSARLQMIRLYLLTGDYDRIGSHLRRLKRRARSMENPIMLAQATLAEGKLASEVAAPGRALDLTWRAVDLIGEQDQPLERAPAHLQLATLLFDMYQQEKALIQLKLAQEAAVSFDHRPLLCQCDALMANIALYQGETDEADSHAEASLQCLRQIDSGPEALNALYRLGFYFLSAGHTEKARLALVAVAGHRASEYGTRRRAELATSGLDLAENGEESADDGDTPVMKLEAVVAALLESPA